MVGEVIFPLCNLLCNLATIYIKDNNVIKYRYYSEEILTPDNVLGRVSYNNKLNLTTGDIGKYNVEDYGVSLEEIHNRIQELINNKDRVVIEKDGRIYLYIKNEDIPQFKNALKRPELQYLDLEEKIIFK